MAEQFSDELGESVVPRLRLDDQLCFALYAATNAVTRSYRPLLGRIGLTYPQYLVMLALWQDGPSDVGTIAGRLQLDSHAVSPLVSRLAAAGLVERERGADRRRVLVSLTDRGRDLERAAPQVQAEVVCAAGLEPAHLARLRRELLTLARTLADADAGADLDPGGSAVGASPPQGGPS